MFRNSGAQKRNSAPQAHLSISEKIDTMHLMKKALASVLLAAVPLIAANPISSAQAKDHVGETATVCGKVVDSRYLETGSHVTFLNFDKPYPNQIFTVLIWGSDRYKFGEPDKSLKGKNICVTGKVTEYRGVPEIVTSTTEQIQSEVKIKEP